MNSDTCQTVTTTDISNGNTRIGGSSSIGVTASVNINSNGVCTNALVGGDSNDILSSSGNCDDQLTGGRGADKFICGEGADVIKDYNAKEGDTILDKQNCETM